MEKTPLTTNRQIQWQRLDAHFPRPTTEGETSAVGKHVIADQMHQDAKNAIQIRIYYSVNTAYGFGLVENAIFRWTHRFEPKTIGDDNRQGSAQANPALPFFQAEATKLGRQGISKVAQRHWR